VKLPRCPVCGHEVRGMDVDLCRRLGCFGSPPLMRNLVEARDLFQKLIDSREFKLYIGEDTTFGRRVVQFLAETKMTQ